MHAMVAQTSSRNTLIGMIAAIAIVGMWITVHLWAMFSFRVTASNWPVMPLIALLQCWLSVGMFIVAHDAMHGSLAPGRKNVNAGTGAFVLFLYAGFGWRSLRDAHFDHHRHVGTAEDPDFSAGNARQFWPWYSQFLRRYFTWRSMAFVWTVVLTYYFLLSVPPENILLLYGIPAIASSLQLFYFGTYRPHRLDDHGFSDRHNSRSNDFGWVKSLLTCFHFGYHHEHHLSPGTPWWALPDQHALYVKERSS